MNKFGTTPILEARHVSMQFGKFKALSDVSTSFAAGSLTAIIGPNGAGKSTFTSAIGSNDGRKTACSKTGRYIT